MDTSTSETANAAAPDRTSARAELLAALPQGLAYWAAGCIPVFLAVLAVYWTDSSGEPLLDYFARWDGNHYLVICADGYSYRTDESSVVAFFPAYPLLGRPLVFLGLSPAAALLLVSQFSLAVSFVVLAAYLRRRFPAEPALGQYILAALAFAPVAFFFRMVYSESLFFLLTILCFYAIQRGVRPLCIALLVGLATATRPTGLALVPPVLLYVWRRSPTSKSFLFRTAAQAPVLGWGLLGYCLYLTLAFNAPFAFSETQNVWWRVPGRPPADKWAALLTLEPFWALFVPDSPCYWQTQVGYWSSRLPGANPWLYFYFVNPVAFAAAVILTAVGRWKGWLNRGEAWLAAGLLLIAYLGKCYELCMLSGARYASVAFPVYLVAGRLLWLLPRTLAYALLALAAGGLAYASACFALGRWCFF